jgi:hypothetical protein
MRACGTPVTYYVPCAPLTLSVGGVNGVHKCTQEFAKERQRDKVAPALQVTIKAVSYRDRRGDKMESMCVLSYPYAPSYFLTCLLLHEPGAAALRKAGPKWLVLGCTRRSYNLVSELCISIHSSSVLPLVMKSTEVLHPWRRLQKCRTDILGGEGQAVQQLCLQVCIHGGDN